MKIRTYSELAQLQTFEERYDYLKLNGIVGSATFGSERWLNQNFYRSREWKLIRQKVIARDYGRDLGAEGYDIHDRIIVHHMNPMIPEDIIRSNDILDPEFLISTTHNTHNAIHYGDVSLLVTGPVIRTPGDTKLW